MTPSRSDPTMAPAPGPRPTGAPSAGAAPYRAGLATLPDAWVLDALPVEGRIPTWLEGTLLRNGPGRFEVGGVSYRHWFDGLAMLHAFTLRGGQVSYRNRFLESRSWREAERSGRIRRSEFATDPCFGLFGRVMATFRPPVTDNANIHVVELADGFAALTETPLPIRFDPETLETLGAVAFEDDLAGTLTTAHPHRDPTSGALYSYLTHLSRTSQYHLYRLDPGSRSRHRIASLPVKHPAYMHSFAMTERHLVLAEFPLVVDPVRLLLSGEPFIRNYRWEPERGTRLQVFDRAKGTHLGCWIAPAMFAFHHVNAFLDAEGEIHLDLVAYDDPAIIDHLYLEPLRTGSPNLPRAELRRLRLEGSGPGAGRGNERRQEDHRVEVRLLSEQNVELPRIHEARVGRSYRHLWGTANEVPGHFTDALVRIDLTTGGARSWHVPGCFPGEPVFVPRPGSTEEDDGVLLSVVLDAAQESSFLLVLDAATLKEEARARVPHPVPLGFHGTFMTKGPSGGIAGSEGGLPRP